MSTPPPSRATERAGPPAFSERTGILRHPNALSVALEGARRDGRRVLDLTVSNPTSAGIPYAEDRILAALADRRSLAYAPSPFGLDDARAAVAETYAEIGATIDPSCIVLTASTSEAYAFLFKLLCDDGDEVLVPQPSYPLFDVLARFEGVRLAPYRLGYDGAWHVDGDAVRGALRRRSRAILVVSPNNPTGSYLKHDEALALARTGLPIVSDEVFAPFSLTPEPHAGSVLAMRAGELVFALGGLSKMAALPQMKLAWIAVGGESEAKVSEALGRLELIADAFLSVGTPVQLAARELLAVRHEPIRAIRERLAKNLAFARDAVAGTAVTLLDVEGGWYATLRLPRTEAEEAWALRFLAEEGVYVHPGHFFDFADEAYVVVSLLSPEALFAEGLTRILSCVEQRLQSSGTSR